MLTSFNLIDACRLPTVLLHGRLLIRNDDSDFIAAAGGAGGGWKQAFVVLTERVIYWLLPPDSRWHAVDLTHAMVGGGGGASSSAFGAVGASGSSGGADVFELSTARLTLRFRCRNAAAAQRWITLLKAACEHQSDNSLLEVPDSMLCDFLESSNQQPLLSRVLASAGAVGPGGTVPPANACSDAEVAAVLAGRLHKLTTQAAADRDGVSAGHNTTYSAGVGSAPTSPSSSSSSSSSGAGAISRPGAGLLPPPRGHFDVGSWPLPSERAVAAALHLLRRPAGATGGSLPSGIASDSTASAVLANVLRAWERKEGSASLVHSSAHHSDRRAVSNPPARRRRRLGLGTGTNRSLSSSAGAAATASARFSDASTPFVAYVPRFVLPQSVFSPSAARPQVAAAFSSSASSGDGSAPSSSPQPSPPPPVGLLGPGALLLEAAALAGCGSSSGPELLARALDGAVASAIARDAASRAQARVPHPTPSAATAAAAAAAVPAQSAPSSADLRAAVAGNRYGGSGQGLTSPLPLARRRDGRAGPGSIAIPSGLSSSAAAPSPIAIGASSYAYSGRTAASTPLHHASSSRQVQQQQNSAGGGTGQQLHVHMQALDGVIGSGVASSSSFSSSSSSSSSAPVAFIRQSSASRSSSLTDSLIGVPPGQAGATAAVEGGGGGGVLSSSIGSVGSFTLGSGHSAAPSPLPPSSSAGVAATGGGGGGGGGLNSASSGGGRSFHGGSFLLNNAAPSSASGASAGVAAGDKGGGGTQRTNHGSLRYGGHTLSPMLKHHPSSAAPPSGLRRESFSATSSSAAPVVAPKAQPAAAIAAAGGGRQLHVAQFGSSSGGVAIVRGSGTASTGLQQEGAGIDGASTVIITATSASQSLATGDAVAYSAQAAVALPAAKGLQHLRSLGH